MIVTGIPMTYRHYVPHSFCTSENASSRTFVNKGKKKDRSPEQLGPRPGGWLAFGLLRFGDHPELLHHAQSVVGVPALRYLAL
jgi:hypothetical protein